MQNVKSAKNYLAILLPSFDSLSRQIAILAYVRDDPYAALRNSP